MSSTPEEPCCPICFDEFTSPRLVPCGNSHVICLSCIEKLIDDAKPNRPMCPMCRKKFEIKGSIHKLPIAKKVMNEVKEYQKYVTIQKDIEQKEFELKHADYNELNKRINNLKNSYLNLSEENTKEKESILSELRFVRKSLIDAVDIVIEDVKSNIDTIGDNVAYPKETFDKINDSLKQSKVGDIRKRHGHLIYSQHQLNKLEKSHEKNKLSNFIRYSRVTIGTTTVSIPSWNSYKSMLDSVKLENNFVDILIGNLGRIYVVYPDVIVMYDGSIECRYESSAIISSTCFSSDLSLLFVPLGNEMIILDENLNLITSHLYEHKSSSFHSFNLYTDIISISNKIYLKEGNTVHYYEINDNTLALKKSIGDGITFEYIYAICFDRENEQIICYDENNMCFIYYDLNLEKNRKVDCSMIDVTDKKIKLFTKENKLYLHNIEETNVSSYNLNENEVNDLGIVLTDTYFLLFDSDEKCFRFDGTKFVSVEL